MFGLVSRTKLTSVTSSIFVRSRSLYSSICHETTICQLPAVLSSQVLSACVSKPHQISFRSYKTNSSPLHSTKHKMQTKTSTPPADPNTYFEDLKMSEKNEAALEGDDTQDLDIEEEIEEAELEDIDNFDNWFDPNTGEYLWLNADPELQPEDIEEYKQILLQSMSEQDMQRFLKYQVRLKRPTKEVKYDPEVDERLELLSPSDSVQIEQNITNNLRPEEMFLFAEQQSDPSALRDLLPSDIQAQLEDVSALDQYPSEINVAEILENIKHDELEQEIDRKLNSEDDDFEDSYGERGLFDAIFDEINETREEVEFEDDETGIEPTLDDPDEALSPAELQSLRSLAESFPSDIKNTILDDNSIFPKDPTDLKKASSPPVSVSEEEEEENLEYLESLVDTLVASAPIEDILDNIVTQSQLSYIAEIDDDSPESVTYKQRMDTLSKMMSPDDVAELPQEIADQLPQNPTIDDLIKVLEKEDDSASFKREMSAITNMSITEEVGDEEDDTQLLDKFEDEDLEVQIQEIDDNIGTIEHLSAGYEALVRKKEEEELLRLEKTPIIKQTLDLIDSIDVPSSLPLPYDMDLSPADSLETLYGKRLAMLQDQIDYYNTLTGNSIIQSLEHSSGKSLDELMETTPTHELTEIIKPNPYIIDPSEVREISLNNLGEEETDAIADQEAHAEEETNYLFERIQKEIKEEFEIDPTGENPSPNVGRMLNVFTGETPSIPYTEVYAEEELDDLVDQDETDEFYRAFDKVTEDIQTDLDDLNEFGEFTELGLPTELFDPTMEKIETKVSQLIQEATENLQDDGEPPLFTIAEDDYQLQALGRALDVIERDPKKAKEEMRAAENIKIDDEDSFGKGEENESAEDIVTSYLTEHDEEEELEMLADSTTYTPVHGLVDIFDRLVVEKQRVLLSQAAKRRRFLIWKTLSWQKRELKRIKKNKNIAQRKAAKAARIADYKKSDDMFYYPTIDVWVHRNLLKNNAFRNAISATLSNPTMDLPTRRKLITGFMADFERLSRPETEDETFVFDTLLETDAPPPEPVDIIENHVAFPGISWEALLKEAEASLEPDVRATRFDFKTPRPKL